MARLNPDPLLVEASQIYQQHRESVLPVVSRNGMAFLLRSAADQHEVSCRQHVMRNLDR